jgi:hypothetical protein
VGFFLAIVEPIGKNIIKAIITNDKSGLNAKLRGLRSNFAPKYIAIPKKKIMAWNNGSVKIVIIRVAQIAIMNLEIGCSL